MIGGMDGLERCPRERPGLEPAIARRARVPAGEEDVECMLAGVAEETCPAGAEAVRRVAAEEVVVDPVGDMVVRLGRLVDVQWPRAIHKGEAGAVQESGRGNQCCAVAQCHVWEHVQTSALWLEIFFVCGWIRMGRTGPEFVDGAGFGSIRQFFFLFDLEPLCTTQVP